jgi:hypothetical protein
VNIAEIEDRLRKLILRIPSPGRAPLLQILANPDDAERAEEIGGLHRSGVLPATAELLIDAEEDPYLRAVLVGMLRETSR